MHTISNKELPEVFFGIHAVQELLKSDQALQKVNKVYLQKNLHSGSLTRINQRAQALHLVVQAVPKNKLDDLSDHGNHQGVVVTVSPFAYVELDTLLEQLHANQQEPFFLILDNLNDPRNFGSILRTADAVGVNGVIIPKRRASGVTGLVAKTATGAIEHLPIVRVTNLVQTIQQLKAAGIWIFGTDMTGTDYRHWNAQGPIALVIGNEGKGLSTLVKQQVDQMLTIPMIGHVQSLNASVAAGILLYQAFTSRKVN